MKDTDSIIKIMGRNRTKNKTRTGIELQDELKTSAIGKIFNKTSATIDNWLKVGKLESKSIYHVLDYIYKYIVAARQREEI